MKIVLLIIIVLAVLITFNILNKYRKKSNKVNRAEDKTIDLEKDPNSDEYRPKE
tara:strand:+ start:190 stop:351 length:162 start_codon:yes stop_codon:yes gene_type:complete